MSESVDEKVRSSCSKLQLSVQFCLRGLYLAFWGRYVLKSMSGIIKLMSSSLSPPCMWFAKNLVLKFPMFQSNNRVKLKWVYKHLWEPLFILLTSQHSHTTSLKEEGKIVYFITKRVVLSLKSIIKILCTVELHVWIYLTSILLTKFSRPLSLVTQQANRQITLEYIVMLLLCKPPTIVMHKVTVCTWGYDNDYISK